MFEQFSQERKKGAIEVCKRYGQIFRQEALFTQPKLAAGFRHHLSLRLVA